jgi:heme/copper-type cytochrome/quinol oxidase subunit 3
MIIILVYHLIEFFALNNIILISCFFIIIGSHESMINLYTAHCLIGECILILLMWE